MVGFIISLTIDSKGFINAIYPEEVTVFNKTTQLLMGRENEIKAETQKLNDELRELNTKKNALMVENASSTEQIKLLQQHIKLIEEKNKWLEKENAELRNKSLQAENMNLDKTALFEKVIRLEKDKERLIKLMKQSEEFKLLGNLSDDNNQISFLHRLGCFTNYDISKIELRNISESKVRACQQYKFKLEEQLWVDSDIVKFTHDLRLKFNGQFTETVVEYLLLGLNTRFLSKIKSFRNSAHLFCKFCKGNNKKLFSYLESENNKDYLNTRKTIKMLGKGKNINCRKKS